MNILLWVEDEKLQKKTGNITLIMFLIEKFSHEWASYHVYTSSGIVIPDDRYNYPVLYEM